MSPNSLPSRHGVWNYSTKRLGIIQLSIHQEPSSVSPLSAEVSSPPGSHSQSSLYNSVASSFKAWEINLLRQEVTSLRSEVLTLSRTATSLQCGQDLELMKGVLSCLNTEVARVRHLTILPPKTTVVCTSSPSLSSICVQSWNCRGIMSGVPYVQHMAEEGADIILCEHWPTPWAWVVTLWVQGLWGGSQRLTETSDLNRGCGGIVILWRKSLLAIPPAALVFELPHMILTFYICYVLPIKIGTTQYLKIKYNSCMQAMRYPGWVVWKLSLILAPCPTGW